MKDSFEKLDQSISIDYFHKHAEEVFRNSRVNEQDFVDVYGEKVVTDDLASAQKKRESFSKGKSAYELELKKVADIFEALILEHGEGSQWFGPEASVVGASNFDDIDNGIDAIIEFRGENPGSASHLGLAADITFTSDTTNKFDRVRERIAKGTLGRIKYFHSKGMGFHGQLSGLPEVVIGADKKTVLQLAELSAGNRTAEKDKTLLEHKIQIMILVQIQNELETFAQYAASEGRSDLAAKFKERLQIVNKILDSKKQIFDKVQYDLNDDNVHSEIMSFLKRWRKTLQTQPGGEESKQAGEEQRRRVAAVQSLRQRGR